MNATRSASIFAAITLACIAAPGAARATVYVQTNLVSNGFVPAAVTDPNLQSPWGISYAPTGPFWVSDNNDNKTTLYTGTGGIVPLVVSVQSPTGQVHNADASGFGIGATGAAKFIFAGGNGTISAWNGGAAATVVASDPTASYNGLTQGSLGGATYLYAADSNNNRVAVFDSAFRPVTLAGNFTDPTLPAGYTVFNTQILNGRLFVAYGNFGTGGGAVAEFDLSGTFVRQVALGGALNLAWGLDLAPAGFGQYASDLLVGDLGDGRINVFDPSTDAYLGQLDGPNGDAIANPGLWAIINGNGASAGGVNTVYFASEGASGVDGVLGSLAVDTPEPATLTMVLGSLGGLLAVRRRSRAG